MTQSDRIMASSETNVEALQKRNNTLLGFSTSSQKDEKPSFPIVTLTSGERVPTGTVAGLLVAMREYDATFAQLEASHSIPSEDGDNADHDKEKGLNVKLKELEDGMRLAIPVLKRVGMFEVFTPQEWIDGGGKARAWVGREAQELMTER